MRCGTTFRIVGTAGAEVKHIEKATLALPLGEQSPKVTERALRRLLNNHVHLNPQRWPSQSRLCRASSPKGRAKGTFLRIRLLFLQCFPPPRGPHQARPGEPASPEGSFCTVLLGGITQLHRLYSLRAMAMNHRRYIACTGYWVVPFNHTGYIRYVPGTAHRPFPAVSPIGAFLSNAFQSRSRPSP